VMEVTRGEKVIGAIRKKQTVGMRGKIKGGGLRGVTTGEGLWGGMWFIIAWKKGIPATRNWKLREKRGG